jgi:hypothetical protein
MRRLLVVLLFAASSALAQTPPADYGALMPAQGTGMAAVDPNGNAAPLKVDAAGNLMTSGGSTGGGGGGSVTQGTTPWVVSGTVNVAGGTTVLNTVSVAGAVTANQGTSPWTVNGTVAATQSGGWTVGQSGAPWGVTGTVAVGGGVTGMVTTLAAGAGLTVVQPVGSNLHVAVDSAPAVTGSVSISGTPTVNIATGTTVLNTVTTTFSAPQHVIVDSGGGSNASVGVQGAAAPGSGTYVGALTSGGANMGPLNLDASGFLKVNVAAGGGAGGTSSSYGAAFPATGTAAGVKDASGNMASLNLDTGGNLKIAGAVTVAGMTTLNASTLFNPTTALPVGGFTYGWSTDQGGWLPIKREGTDSDNEPVIVGASNAPGILSTESYPKMFDGTFWQRQKGTLTNGLLVDVSRVQGTVSTSGTATVSQATGTNLHMVLDSGTVTQGAPNAVANAWPIKFVDSGGVNVGTIKAGSTSAIAGDTSVVVQFNPNQPNLTTPLNVSGTVAVGGGVTSSQLPAALGQTTMAASLPVTIASNQSALSIFNGTIDANNSSTATLAGNATFTGTYFDSFNFGSVEIQVFSNVSSAINGFVVQFSNDGVNADEQYTATFISGGNAFNVQSTLRARYIRVIYTNGASAQASFRLQTLYKNSTPSGDVLEMGDQIQSNSHAQITRAVLSDLGGSIGSIFPNGSLRVTDEPHSLMVDPFDTTAALDTTNRWNAAVTGGTGVACSTATGNLTCGSGTTAGSFSYLTSQPVFQSTTPAWIRFAYNIQLEFPIVGTTYRSWSGATIAATPATTGCPACSSTLQNGAAFELNTDGKMYAATYSNGVRSQVCDLSVVVAGRCNNIACQPANNAPHNYEIYYRPTTIYWFVDRTSTNDVPACTSTLQQALFNVDTLPASYLVVQGSTTSTTITSAAMSVSDEGKNNSTLSDGTYAFRKATISANDATAIGNGLEVQPAASRATPTATTAGRSEKLQVSTTNGGVFANIVGGAGVLPVDVQPQNTAATGNGLETMPATIRSAVAAGTAGRASDLTVDLTTGFQVVSIGDSTTFTKAGVQANDATAIANGLEVQPGVARATPTAITAGRSEKLQQDTGSGGLYVVGAPTTTGAGFTFASFAVNTAANIKASTGNLYGAAVTQSGAAVCWLQFYNTAGAPTCGTSVVYAIPIPVSTGVNYTQPSLIPLFNFSTGIGICASTTPTGGVTCVGTASGTIYFK